MKVLISLVYLTAFASSVFGSPLPEAKAYTEAEIEERALTTYQRVIINQHNVHRFNHSAPAVVWGPNMARYAYVLASRCVFAHNTSIKAYGESYGQNLQIGSPASEVNVAVTNGWYNDEVHNFAGLYGKATPDLSAFEGWGHFTQVVWKGSLKVGCATYDCTAKGGIKDSAGNVINGVAPYITACNYFPVGNVLGSFDKNVGLPLGHPTVGGY